MNLLAGTVFLSFLPLLSSFFLSFLLSIRSVPLYQAYVSSLVQRFFAFRSLSIHLSSRSVQLSYGLSSPTAAHAAAQKLAQHTFSTTTPFPSCSP